MPFVRWGEKAEKEKHFTICVLVSQVTVWYTLTIYSAHIRSLSTTEGERST